ncbi:MAG TPA: hypothetical protein VME20_01355 [Acidimicrobiales bacterium]|nr:hypothetical protein [Acidimicrobiales bacterium]
MSSPSGPLTTYLGTAPGVGKTYTMLAEARRRATAGERVVVGWVDHHDRPGTVAQLGDLDVVPPLSSLPSTLPISSLLGTTRHVSLAPVPSSLSLMSLSGLAMWSSSTSQPT